MPTRVQCRLYLEENILQKFFVCFGFFETGLFVSVVSIRVRNNETNRKIIIFFVHETNRKTDCALFDSNRKYFLFVSRTPYSKVALQKYLRPRKISGLEIGQKIFIVNNQVHFKEILALQFAAKFVFPAA